jgi:hypothetical protein
MTRRRLGHHGANERLRDLLIDAYLSTLVDVHVG